MLDASYIRSIKKHMLTYAGKRREVIKVSDDALHHAKRAIFAFHRGSFDEGEKTLEQAKELIKSVQKNGKKEPRLLQEGSYKAALEEYVEAALVLQFFRGETIGPLKGIDVPEESYIAGLCDVPGELYRAAIAAATAGDDELVDRAMKEASTIIGALIEFNLTSYLRNKFDQAKSAVQKIEHIVYERSLRK